MTTFNLTLMELERVRYEIQNPRCYGHVNDEEIWVTLSDEIAKTLCATIFSALQEDVRRYVVALLPEEESETMLVSLATQHGYGIIRPASSADLPVLTEMPSSPCDVTPLPPATLFLPCLTPVGPSKCLHPGSHHATGGHCTHKGCDCGVFCPDMTTPKVSVSIETVMDYVRRVTLLKNIIWDGDDAFAALHRAWIPGAAPVSDWRPMLGRVFPELAEAFSEVTPL